MKPSEELTTIEEGVAGAQATLGNVRSRISTLAAALSGGESAAEKLEREEREKKDREAKEQLEREAREKREREEREAKEKEAHGEPTTFSPAIIPLSAGELFQSGRGLYDWMGEHSMTPPNWPLIDYYGRDSIFWNQMEATKGNYNFAQIENVLKLAAAKGGRARIRIMTWMAGGSGRQPSYIPTNAGGWPEWNSEAFLQAWENLWAAMGKTFGSDPRLGWIDVGGYGAWGEWHMNGVTVQGSHLTTANGVRMVGAVAKAFPGKHLLLGTSAAIKNEAPLQPPLVPAIVSAFPKIGFHFDNFGSTPPGNGNNLPYFKTFDLEAWEEWAHGGPIVAENWNQAAGWTIANAKQSLEEFHVMHLCSGNCPGSPFKQNQAAWEEDIKRSGFRIQLKTVTLPANLTRGLPFNLAATWENVGVAPTYDPWSIWFYFSSEANRITQASSMDLRTLLPGTAPQHLDLVTLPSTLPAGPYQVSVCLRDPSAYLPPLQLANASRAADGSYPLGTVQVA